MGIYQSSIENMKKSNRGKQPYCAPVKENMHNDNNMTNLETTINTASQADILSKNEFIKKKPSQLYKYSGHYYKKGEQMSVMTVSLHELQGNSNSFIQKQTKNSEIFYPKNNNSIYHTSCLDENESNSNSCSSDEVLEIINDGKMDEKMVHRSTDKTTIENYNEFIGNKKSIDTFNKINIYNRKSYNKNNNNSLKRIEEKDLDSNISGIYPITNRSKLEKKNQISFI